MTQVTLDKDNVIWVEGVPTIYRVMTDKAGAYLFDDYRQEAGEGRHKTVFDAVRAFRGVFFV